MFSCIADLLAPGFNSVSLACSVTQSPGVRLHAGHSMADMWQDIDVPGQIGNVVISGE